MNQLYSRVEEMKGSLKRQLPASQDEEAAVEVIPSIEDWKDAVRDSIMRMTNSAQVMWTQVWRSFKSQGTPLCWKGPERNQAMHSSGLRRQEADCMWKKDYS